MDNLHSIHYVHRGKCIANLPGDQSPPDPPNWTGTFPPKTTQRQTTIYTGKPTTPSFRPAPPRTVRTTRAPTKRANPTKKKCPPSRPNC